MIKTEKHVPAKKALPSLALFTAAIIWGSSFFVVKNTVDVFPPNILLGFRFTIGFALLCLIFHKRLRKIDKGYLISGVVVGAFLFLAYCVQTMGIQTTTAGKNAFLTAIYCVIVPFLFWIVNKKRPDGYNFIAAFICIVGIGLVSLSGGLSIGKGDALTLLGGLFYACQIVAIAKFAGNRDPILLTIVQFGTAAILSWIVGLSTETFSFTGIPAEAWGGLLFLAVCATTVALLLQNVGQKYTNPSSAAVILSLESVFGVLFAVLFAGEQLTGRLIVGFALIFVAILISETKLSFLRRKKPSALPSDCHSTNAE